MSQFVKSTTIAEAVGSIKPFGGSTSPSGWLLCDGTAISRTTYSALFSIISTGFGVGDGSTTFNVPNGQGVFLRGAGSQTINARSKGGGSLGDTNEDKFQGHISAPGDGGVKVDYTVGVKGGGSSGIFNGSTAGAFDSIYTEGLFHDFTNGTPRTGTTTEPSSIDINYIIKY